MELNPQPQWSQRSPADRRVSSERKRWFDDGCSGDLTAQRDERPWPADPGFDFAEMPGDADGCLELFVAYCVAETKSWFGAGSATNDDGSHVSKPPGIGNAILRTARPSPPSCPPRKSVEQWPRA